jgi:hypothetical protein
MGYYTAGRDINECVNTEIDRYPASVQTGENGHIRPEGRLVMDKKHLQSILENLHRELASADSIDEESRVLLQDLAQDVERLAGDADAADVEHESTAGQLQNAALRFESDHPKLAMALGEVIEALSKLGI